MLNVDITAARSRRGQRSISPTARTRRLSNQAQRRLLESALERLLGAAEGILADLDAMDGDPDLEDGHDLEDSFDREAVCEDEGAISGDDEPCEYGRALKYADDGHDQTRLFKVFGSETFLTEVGQCAL